MRRILAHLDRLWRDRSGIIASEFALMLPLLAALLGGAAEFGRLMILSQKVQNSAFLLADLVGRDERIDTATLDDIFVAIDMLMEPFEFDTNGLAIVTSVSGTEDDGPIINWQEVSGVQTLGTSKVGMGTDVDDGLDVNAATLPDVLTLEANETLVVTEILFAFEPLFGFLIDPVTIHRIAYHKPRLGTLETLDP